jgi:hypothetical protein
MAFPAFALGTVKDSGGNPISGATVSWSPGSQSATTDGNGNYARLIQPGTYDVTASASGHQPKTEPNVTYTAGQPKQLNFTLQ